VKVELPLCTKENALTRTAASVEGDANRNSSRKEQESNQKVNEGKKMGEGKPSPLIKQENVKPSKRDE